MANLKLSVMLLYFKFLALASQSFDNVWYSPYQYYIACIFGTINGGLLFIGLQSFIVPLLNFVALLFAGFIGQIILLILISKYLKWARPQEQSDTTMEDIQD